MRQRVTKQHDNKNNNFRINTNIAQQHQMSTPTTSAPPVITSPGNNNTAGSSGSNPAIHGDDVELQRLVQHQHQHPAASDLKSAESKHAANKKKIDPLTDVFYPASPFQSWWDFFAMPSLPAGSGGLSKYARAEMTFFALMNIAVPFSFIYGMWYWSHHLDDLVGKGNYWLELDPPRFNAGWLLPGIDMADHQWRRFEHNLGTLTVALLVYAGVSQGAKRFLGVSKSTSFALYAAMNVGFVIFLHGWGSVMLLAILTAHYLFTVHVGRAAPRWLFQLAMWAALTCLLLANEWNGGFQDWFFATAPAWFAGMFRVPMIAWGNVFNMQMLRLVAFSVDYLEATADAKHAEQRRHDVALKHRTNCHLCGQIAAKHSTAGGGGASTVIAAEVQPLCYKARTEIPRPADEYNFVSYLAYILYLPLYIGGPISSFNGFASHVSVPQKVMLPKEMLRYLFRIFSLYVCLVLLMHTCYVNSIRQQPHILKALPVFDQSGLVFLMLAFLWLKFSVIWKYFRLMGLLDGVEAPEDMNRCFCNTVRVAEFWRDWHASFNLWIVRYMYIPLGGQKMKALVIFPIFLFIALWHDTKMELFSWAIIMAVNLALELTLTMQAQKISVWRSWPFYRHLCILGGEFTVFMLTLANAIGFGLAGSKSSSSSSSSSGKVGGGEAAPSHPTSEYVAVFALWICWIFCTTAVSVIDREIEKNRIRKATEELKSAWERAGVQEAASAASPMTPSTVIQYQ